MAAVESLKVVLLGDSGVGKSSIALRFVTDEFRPYSEATIGGSFMSKTATIPWRECALFDNGSENDANEKKHQSSQQRHIGFKIWDTAGQEKYRSLAPMYYRGASAAILVYDITKLGSFDALQDWVEELAANGPRDLVLVVCGNKLDLDEDRIVDRSTGEDYAKSVGAMYIETSAKAGEGIENLFLEVAKRVPPPVNIDECLEEDVGLDLGRSPENSRGCC